MIAAPPRRLWTSAPRRSSRAPAAASAPTRNLRRHGGVIGCGDRLDTGRREGAGAPFRDGAPDAAAPAGSGRFPSVGARMSRAGRTAPRSGSSGGADDGHDPGRPVSDGAAQHRRAGRPRP